MSWYSKVICNLFQIYFWIKLWFIFSNQEAKDELKKWEISLDTGLVEFDGRLLESEQILYANRSIRYKHDEADWSREGLKIVSFSWIENNKVYSLFKAVV